MGHFIYTCNAIVLEEDEKVKCTVNVSINEIQLIGKFVKHAKCKTIKFDDFRLLSTNIGKEKLGLFKKDYIEIIYNGKSLRKLYIKNIDIAYSFENAIKDKQETIRKEDEEKKRLEEKRKNDVYSDACLLMSKHTLEDLRKAVTRFKTVLDWKDSTVKVRLCNSEIQTLEERERKGKIYNEAVFAMKQDNPASYKIALDKFRGVIDFRDSKQLSARCEEKLDEAYNAALILMSINTILDFKMAIRKFEEIIDWKDSRTKINVCKFKIDEIKLKEENDRKEKTYSDAIKIACGKTVMDQEKAIKLFTEVIDWKDSKEQIEICKQAKKKYEETEFYNKIGQIIAQTQRDADNPQKHSDNIKIVSKTAIDLFIKNPYFILGISCTSEQSKMLDVRDKIEKFARLKLAGGYKSTFDLKNIEKPSRDISCIQTAIVAAKDIATKWLWFETDKYCSWWDKDEIFALYEKEQNCFEYDLVLACFINAMICNPSFADSKKWNVVFTSIDKLLAKPKNELLKILKKHIGSTSLNDEEIIVSFKESILNPITLLFENASKEQISNFSKINIPRIMSEAISSAIVLNVTNLCYPLDIYVREVENDTSKTDINKLLSLINAVENSVYKNIEDYISIVGSNSTYAKRIKKKYKDAIWNATTILENNNLKNKSITYIKEIYEYCDEGDKQRLRNTYGYEELGLSVDELTPGEMNDLAIEWINNGFKQKGIKLLRRAADRGDAHAQSNLAFRYYNGTDGFQKDITRAIKWWEKSGNQGMPVSQHALYTIYIQEGSRQNISEAMSWLRKACDQNFKPSMEVFEKIVNMAKSYDYYECNTGLDLLRKMGLDV